MNKIAPAVIEASTAAFFQLSIGSPTQLVLLRLYSSKTYLERTTRCILQTGPFLYTASPVLRGSMPCAKLRILPSIAGFFIFAVLFVSAQTKPRARDLGIPFDGTPGPNNAITDVKGWKWATPR
jgi:hypothetical protein